MKDWTLRRWMGLLAVVAALALSACAPTDHPYSNYGAHGGGGGNR